MTTLHRLLIAVATLFLAFPAATRADDYPSKPIRLIIPFSPGGLNDVLGRLVADKLSDQLGKRVVPENRTGAGGVVGSELVANAAPDGYVLGITSIANALHPSLYKLSYDGINAFTPVGFVASIPNAFAVKKDLSVNSVKEFIALAKQKPGELQYGSGGAGGSLHLAFELFKDMAGIDVLHVPYKGASPAMIALVGGHVDAVIGSVSSVGPHVRSGKVKGLGVTSKQRSSALPDTPTFTEAGMPEYGGGNWIGVSAPKGTPAAIVDKLNKAMAEILKMPDVQKVLESRGAKGETMSAAEFAKFIETETATWGRVIKAKGIKAQ